MHQFRVIVVTDPQTNKLTHKHKRIHKQTGPITIHCAAKLSVQCKDVCNTWKGKKAIPHTIKMNFLADEVRQTADFHF